jgi:hypothetical protein
MAWLMLFMGTLPLLLYVISDGYGIEDGEEAIG